MSALGDILTTVGDAQYCRGYRDTCVGYHEYRGGTQITKDFPPVVLMIFPTFIMISFMVQILNIPHGTQDIPYGTQDIPHGTHDIFHGTGHTLYIVEPGNFNNLF